jgi:hypothetical protein
VADGSATYAVILDDQMSGPAASAAGALQSLRSSIQADTDELRGMQNAMRAMRADAGASAAEIGALNAKIIAKRAAIAGATREYVRLGGSFQRIKADAPAASAALGEMDPNVRSLLGPLGELTEKAKAASAVLGGGLAVGAIAAVAALAIVTAAMAAAVGMLAGYAVSCADAARSQALLLEAQTGSARAGAALGASIDRVAGSVAISGDRVSKLAADLRAAGVSGDAFEGALRAASVTASTMGDTSAAAFVKAAGAASKTAGAVAALSASVQTKLGGIAARQMLALTVQFERARVNVGKIFAGVDIEPFLAGLASVLSLLDASTASGQALRRMATTMLQPVINTATAAAPIVRDFFRGMVIGALLMAVAVLRVRNAISDAFGGASLPIDTMRVALYAGVAVAVVLVAALTSLVVVMAIVAVAIALFALPFVIGFAIIVAAIALVVAAFTAIVSAVSSAYDYVASIDFGGVGSAMMQGLVDGITAGAGAVMSALRSLAEDMKTTITSALRIGSPSKVFAEFGAHTSGGFAEGVTSGAPRVQSAIESMVSVPDVSASPRGAASPSRGATNVSIVINAASGESSDIADAVERVMREVLTGAAITIGAPLPEGG